jgi:hypothetical protein
VTTFAKGDKENLKLRLEDLDSKLAIVGSRCDEMETLVADLAGDVAILKRSASDSGSDISTDCEDGFWKDLAATTAEEVCNACSAVQHAQAEATHTCTSDTTTRVSACATDFWKHTVDDADVCVSDCAAGFWEDDTGDANVCTACPAGSKCAGGSAAAELCPVGTYQSATAQSDCVAMTSCAVGSAPEFQLGDNSWSTTKEYTTAATGQTSDHGQIAGTCGTCADGFYSLQRQHGPFAVQHARRLPRWRR